MPFPGLGAVAQQIGFQGPSGALSGAGPLQGLLSRIRPEQMQALMGLLSSGQRGLQAQGGGLGAGLGALGAGLGDALQAYQYGRPSNPPLSSSLGGDEEDRRRMLLALMTRLGGGGLG